MQSFSATITTLDNIGVWHVVFVPFDPEQVFGKKGRIDVRGTIDGAPYQRTLLSDGQGGYFFVTNAAMRKQIRKKAGDTVAVTMEPDDTYAVVELPDYFIEELEQYPLASAYYEKSAPSFKRWVLQFLTEPKSADAKANRVIKMIDILEGRARR